MRENTHNFRGVIVALMECQGDAVAFNSSSIHCVLSFRSCGKSYCNSIPFYTIVGQTSRKEEI